MSRIHIPTEWNYRTSIPFEDIKEYLTKEQEEEYKNKILSVDVNLLFENNIEEPELGIPGSFDIYNCEFIHDYPEEIIDAVNKHLNERAQMYSDKAFEKLCDYIDYQKDGDI